MSLASPVRAEIDKDLFDALTVPSVHARYPRDSRAFVRIDTSLRIYWHTLFDTCPQLLELAPPDGLAIFRPFMTWAAEQNLSFDWSYFLWVYEWLRISEFRDRSSEELLLTLMGASAARWAVLDRSSECGVVLASPETSELVVGWKWRSVDGGREVELLELENPLPPAKGFAFFTLSAFEFGNFPGWRPVPR